MGGAGPQGEVGAVGWRPQAVAMAPEGRGAAAARGCLQRGLPGLRSSWGWGGGAGVSRWEARLGGLALPPTTTL